MLGLEVFTWTVATGGTTRTTKVPVASSSRIGRIVLATASPSVAECVTDQRLARAAVSPAMELIAARPAGTDVPELNCDRERPPRDSLIPARSSPQNPCAKLPPIMHRIRYARIWNSVTFEM